MTTTPSAGRKRKPKAESASATSGTAKSSAGARTTTGRTRSKQPARKPAEEEPTANGRPHVKVAHPSIPVPYVTRKDVTNTVRAAGSAMPTRKLPAPDRLAFYGGLGALAVLGAVEWPVAAAIGVATVVARRGREKE
jgi:hypothetical protein